MNEVRVLGTKAVANELDVSETTVRNLANMGVMHPLVDPTTGRRTFLWRDVELGKAHLKKAS